MSDVKVEMDEVIAQPIEQVFAQVTDLVHFSAWMPRLDIFRQCTHISEGSMRVGTTYVDEGWMGKYDGEVVDYQRPVRVVYEETLRWSGRPMVVARMSYELSPMRSGTSVHHIGESELHGVFRLMRPVVELIARGERRRTMRALKASLEAEPPAARVQRAA